MNFAIVFFIVGWVLKFEALFLLLPMLVALIYREPGFYIYPLVAAVCFAVGQLMTMKRPKKPKLYVKEGFLTVALSWIFLSIFGAVPFVLTGDIPSYVDALFEIISGFTTTGASILTDVEALSHSALFWRSFSHWVGGMGVLVFIMAILPLTGGSTMNLMKAESPGPSVDKLVPRVKSTAKILYSIYLVITLTEVIVLLVCRMPLFDALTLTFGTVGTGGFGIKNDSIAGYSVAQQYVITFFMIISGVNYSFFFLLFSRRLRDALGIEEVRAYFIIIAIAVAAICFDTRGIFRSAEESFRTVIFQVGSIITTTGYGTCDFDKWPQFSKTILVILMFVGACAGSTGGGMKVSRLMIAIRAIRKEISLMLHPREIRKIQMDGRTVAHEVIRSTNVFIAVYFLLLFFSILLIGMDEFDFTTNFTAVAATLNNIGPGLEKVGPACNYSIYSNFSKCILMFDMLAGRLELFPMLLVLVPATWRRKKI